MRTSFGAGPTPGAGLAGASSSSWRRRWRCTRARSSAWTCHHSCSAVWMSGSAWWSRCHGAVCAQGTGILRGRLFCKSAPGADEIGTDRVAGAVAAGRCCPHLWRWRSRHAQRRPRREPLGPLGEGLWKAHAHAVRYQRLARHSQDTNRHYSDTARHDSDTKRH